MFGALDFEKVAMLLTLGLFLFGPERLPAVAADLAAVLRRIRSVSSQWQEQIAQELGPELGQADLRSLHPRALVQQHLFGDDWADQSPGSAALARAEVPPWDSDAT